MITYLKKANDDLISHCSCGDGRATFPSQMDCPWCGCGWLFSCITCRKAFTFAVGVELDTTWEDLAREDLRNGWEDEPSEEEIADWIETMRETLGEVQPGEQYVIVDGTVIRAQATNVQFTGWTAHHEFAQMPQVRALTNKAVLKEQLQNGQYWISHRI